MPKKTIPYITQFFQRDENAFTALSKVGHLTENHLKDCGLANGRIRNYCKDGYIEKIYSKNQNEPTESYKLTKSGRKLGEINWGLKDHYHSQSAIHDIAIANKYFSLNDYQKENFKTETEIQGRLTTYFAELRENGDNEKANLYENMYKDGFISTPDCCYVTETGTEIYFEVITNNYGEAELLAKEVFIQIMGGSFETTRV